MVACHAVEQGWLTQEPQETSKEEQRHQELGAHRGTPSHRLGLG
jgi:hypothetical protein